MKHSKQNGTPGPVPEAPEPYQLTLPGIVERFPTGGGWNVSLSPPAGRLRAPSATNMANRARAVARLKERARAARLIVWGDYQTQESVLRYVHDDESCPNYGEIYARRAAELAKGQLACGCNRRAAAAERKLSITDLNGLAESRAGRLLSRSYTNNRQLLEWKCEDGHRFHMAAEDVQRGRWCSRCWDSKAQRLCGILASKLLGMDFEHERTPAFLADACRGAGIPLLRFDLWCAQHSIAIEHHGPHHYEPVIRRSRNGEPCAREREAEEKFETQQRNDEAKRQAAVGKCSLIIVSDISKHGYGFKQADVIIERVATAIITALPKDQLPAGYEGALDYLRGLRPRGWTNLIQPIFAGTRTRKRLDALARSRGGKVVRFVNDRRVRLECEHGHRWTASVANVLHGGTWCPVEGVQKRARARRLTYGDAQGRLLGFGLRLDWDQAEFEGRYVNNNVTPVPVQRLACGARFSRALAKLQARSLCPECKGVRVCRREAGRGA